jgi:hypothetical protein
MREVEGHVKPMDFAVLLVALAIACRQSRYRDPLAGTEYVPRVPEAQLARTWTLNRQPQASLKLRADHSCLASGELIAYFQACEQAYPAKDHPAAGCGWTVEQKPDSGQVVVTFTGRDDAWFSSAFGVFRNVQNQALVLAGTCGSGDAYGLWPAEQDTKETP